MQRKCDWGFWIGFSLKVIAKWLCDSLWTLDCSPRGSSVRGILHAGILKLVAMPFSIGSFQPRDWTCVSYISWTERRVLYHLVWTVCIFNIATFLCIFIIILHIYVNIYVILHFYLYMLDIQKNSLKKYLICMVMAM